MEMGSGSRGGSGSSDTIKGLTFGEKIYFEDGGGGGSSSGQSEKPPGGKKGKGLVQGAQQPPRCQVEGCKTDLSGAKAYYLRHKVCGMHSKSPKVIVAGLEQRFCQQCSRFHLLPEFDQGKRSCRRRLAGHNERRRKPHPVPPLSRYGRLPSFQEESGRRRSCLMDFTYPQPPGREVWPTIRASSNWQAGFSPPPSRVPEHGTHQYMQGPIGGNVFPNRGTPPAECFAGVSDSSCALSLLSTQPWCTSTRSQAPAAPASISFDSAPMAQNVVSDNYAGGSYGFRGHGTSSSSNELQHGMALGQIQHTGDAQFSGELELALQGNRLQLYPGSGREYDQSDHGHGHGHGMHWSL